HQTMSPRRSTSAPMLQFPMSARSSVVLRYPCGAASWQHRLPRSSLSPLAGRLLARRCAERRFPGTPLAKNNLRPRTRRMETIRLQLRFLLPLLATLIGAAFVALPLMDRLNQRWFARDLNARGGLVANTLGAAAAGETDETKLPRLQSLFERA